MIIASFTLVFQLNLCYFSNVFIQEFSVWNLIEMIIFWVKLLLLLLPFLRNGFEYSQKWIFGIFFFIILRNQIIFETAAYVRLNGNSANCISSTERDKQFGFLAIWKCLSYQNNELFARKLAFNYIYYVMTHDRFAILFLLLFFFWSQLIIIIIIQATMQKCGFVLHSKFLIFIKS